MSIRKLKSRVLALFGSACQRCGYDRCERALQLHHLDPATKAKRVHQATILREAEQHPERFILLCANCHFEEHDAQDRARWPTVECLHCHKPFMVKPFVLSIGRGRYCSRSCSASATLTGRKRGPYRPRAAS